ncbi:MAG: hypothetical protein DRN08_03990 [Thermoplasmata archaeon]|nr:MAG: hypothetical protein DRN08_03990 [Thermoplasmata archaeon]
MRRIERIYSEIIQKIIKHNKRVFTQKKLAEECNISIGTVNYALKPLHQMGIIEKKQRNFKTLNPKKLLLYWASIRNLNSDITYSTYSSKNIREIELMMPPCTFTAYTGYKNIFKSTPADYTEIYAYADPTTIKKNDSHPPHQIEKK